MLDARTIKERIDAARTLRGLTQTELGDLLHSDGLGKHDVGRIERGTMTLQAVHRHALCRHLGVPEDWFLEPDLDRLLGIISSDEIRDRLERIETALDDLAADDGGRVKPSVTERARAAAQRLAGTPEASPGTGDAPGVEDQAT